MASKVKQAKLKKFLKVMQKQVKPSPQLETKVLEFERLNGPTNFLKLVVSSLNAVLVLKGVITAEELQSMVEAQIDEEIKEQKGDGNGK